MNLLGELLKTLDLKELPNGRFQGSSLDIGSPFVYGGQVLAQALVAANKTAPDNKYLNSLHGYFLRRGDNDLPIEYDVSTLRDGRSFSTRRVTAYQKGKIIYIMAGRFHIHEDGLEHQKSMPNVAQPESLTAFSELFSEFAEKFDFKPRGLYSEQSPIVFHPVEKYNPFEPGILPPRGHTWFKPADEIPDDPVLHQAILAYVSDFSLLISSLLPHNVSLFKTPMNIASLDHAMWFHRKVKCTDWCLYEVESPNAGGSRGFCQGKMYARDGTLIASTAQEGLIRLFKSEE